MMYPDIPLYYHTLKYLKLRQVAYRLYYLIRNKLGAVNYTVQKMSDQKEQQIVPLLCPGAPILPSCYKEGVFTFLNLSYRFDDRIDWNFSGYGKLWTYNLTYFDYLQQESMTKSKGMALIYDFIKQSEDIRDGMMPFPISLRAVNWIRFLSRYQIDDPVVNRSLYSQYQKLMENLEYHIMGNHLLENGFSLLFGAYFFRDEKFYSKAKEILEAELDEQILSDGAHFELTPMYHLIMLQRVLDSINLISNNLWKTDTLLDMLREKASKMTGWIVAMQFRNGQLPRVNDTAEGIALAPERLLSYAKSMGISVAKVALGESGYRKRTNDRYECLIDVGNIGPDYIPGHAHSDTFSFEFYVDGKPVIVDTGISTYENNAKRHYERSTAAHNTVEINGEDQSRVWGAFRVAQRAKIVSLTEDVNVLCATHDGYSDQGILHTRRWVFDSDSIKIVDSITGGALSSAVSYLHFYPGTDVRIEGDSVVTPSLRIRYQGAEVLELGEYEYAEAFNQCRKAPVISAKIGRESTMEVEII